MNTAARVAAQQITAKQITVTALVRGARVTSEFDDVVDAIDYADRERARGRHVAMTVVDPAGKAHAIKLT